MRRVFASIVVTCLFCIAPTAHAAIFTDTQVSSLLGLLTAFGVPQDTINTVHSIISSNSDESTFDPFAPGARQHITYISRHSRSTSTPEPDPEPGPYIAKAVHFDGDTFLANQSLSSTDNQYLSISFWIKDVDFSALPTIFVQDPLNTYISWFQTAGTTEWTLGWGNAIANEWDSNRFAVDTAPTWHHIIESVDSVKGSNYIQAYVDDVPVTFDNEEHSGAISTISFNGYPLYIGDDTYGDVLIGDIADLWIAPGQSLLDGGGDIPEATRRKFISADGKPVDLGTHCAAPTGVAPAVCFSGDSSDFATNKGTGGSFDLTGTLTDAGTSPSD